MTWRRFATVALAILFGLAFGLAAEPIYDWWMERKARRAA